MINEYYANIKGYEGLYQVSNCGNVKSITHYRKNRYNKKQIVKGKLLKLNDDRSKGYLIVTLCKNGKRKTYRVHRLVAETFIDNLENLPQVNHKDGNKYNNHINNLEWCSCKENIRHAWKNKLNFVSDKHREVARETQKRRWEEYRKSKIEDKFGGVM